MPGWREERRLRRFCLEKGIHPADLQSRSEGCKRLPGTYDRNICKEGRGGIQGRRDGGISLLRHCGYTVILWLWAWAFLQPFCQVLIRGTFLEGLTLAIRGFVLYFVQLRIAKVKGLPR